MVSTGSGLVGGLIAVGIVPEVRSFVRFGPRGLRLLLVGALVGAAVLGTYHASHLGDALVVHPDRLDRGVLLSPRSRR